MKIFYGIISIGLLMFNLIAFGEDVEPPKEGNFILPASQTPGPLISFGENMIEKDETQLFLAADKFGGQDKYMIDVIPSLLYGLRDDLSLYFLVPIAARFKQGIHHSSGFEDSIIQLEYAFYSGKTYDYTDQATVVGNMSIPLGSRTASPNTGFGSPSYFIGTTFNRTYIHWFLFTSYGALFPTENNGDHFGNQYLYQAGLGRNLFDIGTDWIFAGMVEGDGNYSQKNTINGATNPNSGGNIVYVTPSIWISSKHLAFQFGAGIAAYQNLFGNQPRNEYLISGSIAWSFYSV